MIGLSAEIFRAAKAEIPMEDKWLHKSVAPDGDILTEWYKPRSAKDRRLDMSLAVFQAIIDRVQEGTDTCDQMTIAASELLWRLAPGKWEMGYGWEDQPERTLAEVHAMLDRAAEACE